MVVYKMQRSVKHMRHHAKASQVQRESNRDAPPLSIADIRLMTKVNSMYDIMQVNQDLYIPRLWAVNVFYWIPKYNFQT